MRDVVASERDVQRATCACGEVLLGVRPDDRAHALDRVDRSRIGAVERSYSLQAIISAGPRDGEASAHAKADGADSIRVDLGQAGEVSERELQVLDSESIH